MPWRDAWRRQAPWRTAAQEMTVRRSGDLQHTFATWHREAGTLTHELQRLGWLENAINGRTVCPRCAGRPAICGKSSRLIHSAKEYFSVKDDIETSENTLDRLSEEEIAEFREEIRDLTHKQSNLVLPLENLLGLTAGFVKDLLDEKDDWAFIIKLAVVVEASLGKVVNAYLQNPSMEKHVRMLPMDGRTGKIQLARDLGIIGPKAMARLRAIAEIRNDFAHNPGVIQLSIKEYFSRLSGVDAVALYEKFFAIDGHEKPSQVGKPKNTLETNEEDGKISKLLVWCCAWLALSELAAAYRRISNESNWRAALVVLGEAFLCRQRGDESSAREKMMVAIDTLKKIAEVHSNAR